MKLLITLDGSPEGEAILDAVVPLVQATHADLTLLTVVSPGKGTYPPPEHGVPWIEGTDLSALDLSINREPPVPEPVESRGQADARVVDTGADYLAAIKARLAEKGVRANQKVIVSEDVSESIIDFARQEGFNLIAMSTHGRSGLSALVQGSVATEVIRSGVLPVLMVRPVLTP